MRKNKHLGDSSSLLRKLSKRKKQRHRTDMRLGRFCISFQKFLCDTKIMIGNQERANQGLLRIQTPIKGPIGPFLNESGRFDTR